MLIGPHGSIVCYNFAPASISLGERPFLYDIIGSLKISLSNSCSSIKRHLLMRISLSLELLDVNLLQRARFDCLFFPVGGGPVYVLKLSILKVCG